jgi:hypothetical protein
MRSSKLEWDVEGMSELVRRPRYINARTERAGVSRGFDCEGRKWNEEKLRQARAA